MARAATKAEQESPTASMPRSRQQSSRKQGAEICQPAASLEGAAKADQGEPKFVVLRGLKRRAELNGQIVSVPNLEPHKCGRWSG